MKFFTKMKDGGPDSPVEGYFLFEIKGLCSVALLKFNKGTREAYHTHAFNALTWFIKGNMREEKFRHSLCSVYTRSLLPKVTMRDNNHRVVAEEDSWCFTLRGPWSKYWTETNPRTGATTKLTHGRIVIRKEPCYKSRLKDAVALLDSKSKYYLQEQWNLEDSLTEEEKR